MSFLKKNIKWLGIAFCALTIIGEFLPFISGSAYGMKIASDPLIKYTAPGMIVLGATVITAILFFFNKSWMVKK